MRVIYYQNRQVSVPETLEELTPAQYYRYLEIATMANQHILSEPGVRLKILSLFLALPVDMGHLPPSTWKETLALLSLTDPFVIREGKSFRLDLSTGINLLPEWNGFHGPEDMLNGVSFDTFCKCMALVRRMGDEGGGDRDMILREFGKALYTGREGAEPPILLCLHAYLFFMNVFAIIREEPLEIDGETVDLRILFRKDEKPEADDHTGWTGIGMDIAENGAFGNYAEVRATPFWDILIFLYRKKFEKLHSKR